MFLIPRPVLRSKICAALLTLALGAVGGLFFHYLGLPAPWLSGSMVVVAVATLLGGRTSVPSTLRDTLFVVLGISMGSGVRPDVIERIGHWPLSLALLFAVIASITVATYIFLVHVARWDRTTALFSAIPGALSYVLALAADSKADLRRVGISQTIRLFFLVAILPSVLSDGAIIASGRPTAASLDPMPLALLLLSAAAAGWLANRLRIPAGWLTGPFLLSSLLNGSGLVVVVLPVWMVVPCFVALGALIGTRFAGADLREFLRYLSASVGAFVVGIAISATYSLLLSRITDIPFGQALLAYAPGGLEAMTLLAFMLGLDPAFVATHQLARYVAMVLLLPMSIRLVLGTDWKSGGNA